MSDHQEITAETIAAAVGKSVPPVTVAGLTMAGVQLSDIVLILTIVWLCLQIGGFCWDRYKRGNVRGSKRK